MTLLEKEFLFKIEKHKGVILKISKMYMDNTENQNDLFQEIIYQAWKSYERFRGDSEFSTWLYKIALNTTMVFLKSEKKKKSFIQNQNISNIKIQQELYSDIEEQHLKLMYDSIKKLNPIDKMLIFYYLEDFSGKQIAEQLGISEVNARVKLNRAKNRLKEIIDKKRH